MHFEQLSSKIKKFDISKHLTNYLNEEYKKADPGIIREIINKGNVEDAIKNSYTLSNALENQQRAQKFMMTYFAMLSFFMLFFLDRGTVSTDIIILIGSLGYALGFILSPALIYYFDKVQD